MIEIYEEACEKKEKHEHKIKIKHSAEFQRNDVHMICFLVEGKDRWFVGDDVFVLNPYELVFVYKNELYNTDQMAENSKKFVLKFDDDFFEEEYLEIIATLKNVRHVKFLPQYTLEFVELFGELILEQKNNHVQCYEMMQLYIRRLLLMIMRHWEKNDKIKHDNPYAIIRKAMDYIRDNVGSDDLNLGVISKKYSFSPGYFSELFKEIAGVRFSEYVNISKVLKAQQLLEKGDVSIIEIATQCGFNDSNYFTRIFKKLTGECPSVYAKRFKK